MEKERAERISEDTEQSATSPNKLKKEIRDANTCIAAGAGVGVLGAAAAVMSGAVCPLCIFVAPGLIAVGAYRRRQLSRKQIKN